MSATAWAWLVLLLPLLGSIVIALGFRAIPARVAGVIGTAAIALAFACGVAALVNLLGEDPEARHHASSLWDYASAAGLDIKLGILVDPLSVFMVLVVTGVSSLIHLYSFGYMQSDEGYHRFFSYLNFFVFSMLLLVLAGNFVLLIVGWAFVGFASYALISFWYRRTTATGAGMKAFVINVVGDIGLVLAAFLIFRELGTFEYGAVFARAPEVFPTNGEWTVTAICLLLLVGAFAKSAQLPLHTWLPDAMEGPTPVSSLIHAATMVTAGVYLIARTHVLFVPRPDRRRHRRLRRPGDAAGRRHDRDRDDRPEAGDRLLDDEPDRLHDHRRLDRRLRAGPLPPDDPRLLQGAAVHGRRLDHLGDGEPPGHRPDERLLEGDALHLGAVPDRRPGAGRLPGHLRLLLQGLDPRLRRGARRDVRVDGDRRLRRRLPHRDLHLPAHLPRPARRPVPRRPST